MKQLYFILIFTVFCTLNCDEVINQQVTGQGVMVNSSSTMDEIHSIGLGISADVYITQGNSQSIEFKGPQNIIDLIKKTPVNGTWNIEFERKKRIKSKEKIEIYITMKELRNLSVGGSGSIISKNKFTNVDDLDLSIGGSGNIKVDAEADDIRCSIGGSGEIKLGGSADDLRVNIGGSGNVRAFDLSVQTCKVNSSGSGNIYINAREQLSVSLAGSGDVRYKGDPKIKSNIVGSGNLSRY